MPREAPVASSSSLERHQRRRARAPSASASAFASPSSSSLSDASRKPAPCTPRPSSSSSFGSFPALALLSLAALASFTTFANAAVFEPPGDQVLFGAWINSGAGYNDTPTGFNERIGYNVPVFQIAQDIPLPVYNYTTGAGGAALENLIEDSSTDAAVFLTVYPADGFAAVTDSDYTALANQIHDYQTIYNRTVFLRYAPEMQGTWNLYGMQPTAFNTSWHALHATVIAIAPATLFVWAPNTPQGYPYGQTFAAEDTSAADQLLLDTNGNGVLDSNDNALSPYYPGDDVVDWIGISLYYKGTEASDIVNVVQTAGYCAQAINGTNPATGTNITNWYDTYCAKKPTKACMFSESGAAYHDTDGGVSQLAIQSEWISDCITNTTMFDAFPRLKLVMQFEFQKFETSNENTQDLRDYRITNDTEVLSAFLADLGPVATRFSWANHRAKPTSISSVGAPAATNSAGSTIVQAITQTTRARPTTFPSLFGSTSDGTQRAEIVELAVLVTSGIAGALVVMRLL